MARITLRIDEDLVAQITAVAQAHGMSLNRWATAVPATAVDPDIVGNEADQIRARLRREGLLETPVQSGPGRPPAHEVERARAAAGRGRPLSDFVREGRG